MPPAERPQNPFHRALFVGVRRWGFWLTDLLLLHYVSVSFSAKDIWTIFLFAGDSVEFGIAVAYWKKTPTVGERLSATWLFTILLWLVSASTSFVVGLGLTTPASTATHHWPSASSPQTRQFLFSSPYSLYYQIFFPSPEPTGDSGRSAFRSGFLGCSYLLSARGTLGISDLPSRYGGIFFEMPRGLLSTMNNPSDDEQLSWNIIDREISEWQYVCQTGRPYRWSPESKYARLKNLQPRLVHEPSPRNWTKNIDQHSNPEYMERRRALSDSYLADSNTVQDLAHLVAIQLLGACFTLPPDHVRGAPSPNYGSLSEHSSTNVPNPRMISSLRLHTHFRYSPCFGHQARSPSPVQLWPGTFDGSSTSEAHSPSNETLETSGHISKNSLRLDISGEKGLFDFESADHERAHTELIPKAASKSWYRRHGIRDFNSRVFKRYHNSHDGKKVTTRAHASHPSQLEIDRDNTDIQHTLQFTRTVSRTDDMNQPMTESNAHHSKRESVRRRWSKIRRRFGSLHSDVSISGSEDQSSASESTPCGTPSFSIESSAITRRKRVQKRGDIETSSMEDSPHYNSPMSGNLSPVEGGHDSAWRESRSLSAAATFPLAEVIAAAEYHVPRYTNRHRQSLAQRSSEVSPSEMAPKLLVPSINTSLTAYGSGKTGSDACDCRHAETSPNSMAPAFPTPRRTSTRGRDRRKSMLSEVCTPDDYNELTKWNNADRFERGGLSAAGSALVSPREETEPFLLMRRPARADEELTLGQDESMSRRSASLEEYHRPKFPRTSTSGTQIFTPDVDGIEIDGLPVGPSREIWANGGKRGERTYL